VIVGRGFDSLRGELFGDVEEFLLEFFYGLESLAWIDFQGFEDNFVQYWGEWEVWRKG
jgi:hypothetical protein